MLHLSLHAGPLGNAAFNNMLGFVDMATRQRDIVQDYKFQFFTSRQPTAPIIGLAKYPRFSASVWDLVGRAIALHLHEREQAERQELADFEHKLAADLCAELGMPKPPAPASGRMELWEQSPAFVAPTLRPAYATRVCAILERPPDVTRRVSEVLARVEIECKDKRAGRYVARFDEPGFECEVVSFTHAPRTLSHWRLLLAAIGHRLCGQDQLPPRPPPVIPEGSVVDGARVVQLDSIAQPCRAWLCKWLLAKEDYFSLEQGVVSEAAVTKFLLEA